MSHPNDAAFPSETAGGLTKRELIAAMIYAQMYVACIGDPVKSAVKAADNLIQELNK